jgi:4-amino-4-deoxy-L-arabinose transferase-like glycosyltransferase
MHGDSAECGLLGLKILHQGVADIFDFSPWYATPYISFLPHALSFELTGLSVLGLRLPSAIFGIASIASVYILVRLWFGTRVALFSTALYAVSHAAIHFSRIGLWNIQVLFYAVTAFSFLAVGLRSRSALCGAIAGMLSGMALYSYTAGRLIPLLIVLFLLPQMTRRRPRRVAAYWSAGLLLAALPLVLNYVKDPSVLSVDRTASVWVLADINRPHVEATLGVDQPAAILLEQTKRTLLGFISIGDMSGQYGTEQPLLSPFIALLALLGVLVSLFHLRDRRHAFLLAWIGLGLLLGSVLIIDPPSHTRLIAVFPVPFIFAALGLGALTSLVARRFTLRGPEVAIVYLLFVAQSAAFNLAGYYGFAQQQEAVPREWDVLKVMARNGGRYDYYLFTGPFLFADSPVLRLFSTGTRAVTAFSEADLPRRLARDAAFVVMPEFRRISMAILDHYPGAERSEVTEEGVVKAYVYRCTAENGCRGGIG